MADPSSLAYHWGEFEQVKGGSKKKSPAAATMSSASKARGGGGGSWEDLRKEVIENKVEFYPLDVPNITHSGPPTREPDRHEAGLAGEAGDQLQQEQLRLGQDAAPRRRRVLQPERLRDALRGALPAARPLVGGALKLTLLMDVTL